MIPFDQIAVLYEQTQMPRSFEEDMTAHISTGYVVSTPEYFIMGRAVDREAPPELIDDPWHAFPQPLQNTWLVYAFAGSSRNFLSFVPYPLKWVAFQRRGQALRIYDFNQITKRCASLMCSTIG